MNTLNWDQIPNPQLPFVPVQLVIASPDDKAMLFSTLTELGWEIHQETHSVFNMKFVGTGRHSFVLCFNEYITKGRLYGITHNEMRVFSFELSQETTD